MRSAFLIGIGLWLAGCATERTVLVNNQGDQMTCETGGAGFFGSVSVANQQDKCIADAQERGYRVK
jgi:hypothetical protein